MRPLVVSLCFMYIPLFMMTFARNEYTLLTLLLFMWTIGLCHHSHYVPHGLCHHTDRVLCWVLISYTAWLNATKYLSYSYWIFLILVGLMYMLSFHCDYQCDSKRNWDNFIQLIPHALMHIFAGIGIGTMLLKK